MSGCTTGRRKPFRKIRNKGLSHRDFGSDSFFVQSLMKSMPYEVLLGLDNPPQMIYLGRK